MCSSRQDIATHMCYFCPSELMIQIHIVTQGIQSSCNFSAKTTHVNYIYYRLSRIGGRTLTRTFNVIFILYCLFRQKHFLISFKIHFVWQFQTLFRNFQMFYYGSHIKSRKQISSCSVDLSNSTNCIHSMTMYMISYCPV